MTGTSILKTTPNYYTYYFTFRCNLACRMCYQNSLRKQVHEELTLKEIISLFDRIKDIARVNLIGGEVFVRSDFLEVIEYFDSRGVETYVTSNGVLLDSKTIQRLHRLRHLLGITISLDALGDTYRAIRGKETDPDSVLKCIRTLAEHTEVRINSVLLKENIHGFEALIRSLAHTGASLMKLQLQIAHSPWVISASERYCSSWLGKQVSCLYGSNRVTWDSAWLAAAINMIRSLGERYGLPILLSHPELGGFLEGYASETLWMNHYLQCEGMERIPRLKILPNGDVIFCEGLDMTLGNLHRQTPDEIRDSQVLRTFLENFARMGGLPICQRCCRVIVGSQRQEPLSGKL